LVAATQNCRGTNQGPYSMSKCAVHSLSAALEHELEGTNVGVTALRPGPIAINIARGAHNRPDHLGDPQVRPADEAVLAERLARTGIDPKLVNEQASALAIARKLGDKARQAPPTRNFDDRQRRRRHQHRFRRSRDGRTYP
jgi:short-subunit dehydrogenase